MTESRGGVSRNEDFSAKKVDTNKHSEIVKGLNSFVEKKLTILPHPDRLWQPSDMLPDLNQEDWPERIQSLQEQAKNLSPDLLVVAAGALISEEALPTYPTWINRIDAVRDETGTDGSPWARWTRAWTAEENRHGDVLNSYMFLSGRINMSSVEKTTQHLLRAGFNPQVGKDPYKALVFVAIQEEATHVSHKNSGKIAKEQGDETLSKIFIKISGDEARHMAFYQEVVGEIFKEDPNEATIAVRDVFKQGVNMPGMLMTQDGVLPPSGKQTQLYQQLSNASIRCEAYTPSDYINVFKHIMDTWNVEKLPLSGDGAKAQEDLGKTLRVYERAIERFTPRQTTPATNLVYSWLK